MRLIDRFFTPIHGSYFLFGPRGTGKSTFLKKFYHDAPMIDFLRQDVLLDFRMNPDMLSQLLSGSPNQKTWILDEVQRFPEVLSTVHFWMEKRPELTFVLTGSSARKLKAQSADLLGGRALDLRIHPFMAAELGDQFDLVDALRYGLVPVIWGKREREMRLKSYISLYLQMEVEMERLVRNIQTFTDFLKAASFSHGSLVNCANIARECGAKPGTVASYFDLIDDLMLGFRLNVFAKRAKRELVSSQKFYYFDAGVFCSLRPKGPLDAPSELFGPALEGLVAQHLRAWIQYRRQDVNLSFWRSRGGVEVDFVIYGESVFVAIEVKNSARIDAKDLAPLKEFASDYPESTQVLLYGGTHKLRKGNIWCIPVADFLKNLHPAKGLDEVVEN